jgi:hypothetical protein
MTVGSWAAKPLDGAKRGLRDRGLIGNAIRLLGLEIGLIVDRVSRKEISNGSPRGRQRRAGKPTVDSIGLRVDPRLVHRLVCSWHMAAGQLAVFRGASEAPLSESSRSSEQHGKTANWPRPGGLP